MHTVSGYLVFGISRIGFVFMVGQHGYFSIFRLVGGRRLLRRHILVVDTTCLGTYALELGLPVRFSGGQYGFVVVPFSRFQYLA